MTLFSRLRLYHTALGGLAALAYASEDWTSLHVLVGYTLVAIVSLRIASILLAPRLLPRPAWLLSAQDHQPKLGLGNPVVSKAFIAGIMVALAMTIVTGLTLDQKRAPQTDAIHLVTQARADDDRKTKDRKRSTGDKILKEIHETTANGMFVLVGLHVGYLLLMNRRYALRMLFIDNKR